MIEVLHIHEGVTPYIRGTGIRVVLEVKNPGYSEAVITALELSGFQLR